MVGWAAISMETEVLRLLQVLLRLLRLVRLNSMLATMSGHHVEQTELRIRNSILKLSYSGYPVSYMVSEPEGPIAKADF